MAGEKISDRNAQEVFKKMFVTEAPVKVPTEKKAEPQKGPTRERTDEKALVGPIHRISVNVTHEIYRALKLKAVDDPNHDMSYHARRALSAYLGLDHSES